MHESVGNGANSLWRVKVFCGTDGVKAKVYFRGAPYERDGRTYLRLQQLKLDFSVKDIQMGVENLQNGNAVLRK